MEKRSIKDIPLESLAAELGALGLKRYAADQIIQWLYRFRVTSFEEMTNISKTNRDLLEDRYLISRLSVDKHLVSKDGTEKFLWKLTDGHKIESVYIPNAARVTLCISTQVGCAMGCTFCRTAKMGLIRNLTTSEIVDQVVEVQRLMAARAEAGEGPNDKPVTNVVFMGMGEPLHNVTHVIEAARILTEPTAVGIAKRKVTISTSGLVPGIKKLAEAKTGVKLALSLNGTTDEYRGDVMPITKKYPIEALMKACHYYLSHNPNQRVTFEYVMLEHVNDTIEDAKRLVKLMSHIPSKVNLIPLNVHNKCDNGPSDHPTIDRFFRYLQDHHIQANIRANRGQDILAACGQLADLKE